MTAQQTSYAYAAPTATAGSDDELGFRNYPPATSVDDVKEITDNFGAIRARFIVLGTLQGGYKIWVTTDPITGVDTFSIDNSFFPSIVRGSYGQNRERIINIINADVTYIRLKYNRLNPKAKNILKKHIETALPGLKNMKETYGNDTEKVTELQTIIDNLTKYTQLSGPI